MKMKCSRSDKLTKVGYSAKEIKSLSTHELINLKNSIVDYFEMANKRKMINEDYRKMYKRINIELNEREKAKAAKQKNSQNKTDNKNGSFEAKFTTINADAVLKERMESLFTVKEKVCKSKSFLFDVPGIFNDKCSEDKSTTNNESVGEENLKNSAVISEDYFMNNRKFDIFQELAVEERLENEFLIGNGIGYSEKLSDDYFNDDNFWLL
jgi:hypothetical protein